MITSFTVEAFKSLKKVQIDLGQVNYFIGANGSGKSNLLEALGVISAATFGKIDDESLQRRGVRPGVPQLYKSSFKDVRLPTTIKFNAENGVGTSYSVSIYNPITNPSGAWSFNTELFKSKSKRIWGRSQRSKEKLNPKLGGSFGVLLDLSDDDPLALLLNCLSAYAIYTPSTQTLRGIVPDSQQREPVGLSGGRLPEALSRLWKDDVLKELWFPYSSDIFELMDWVKSIAVVSPGSLPLSPSAPSGNRVIRFTDRYMAESRNTLSGYDASEGALYILFMAVMALHPDAPPTFAIDNADHGLNPVLAKKLTTNFCNWMLTAHTERQALLTTHNPMVLDGLPFDDDRIRLFVVERTVGGWTNVRRINIDNKIRLLAQQGWTLSRMWAHGDLGGVPNV